jgi:predicted RNA-binding Zn ribbon-like protein
MRLDGGHPALDLVNTVYGAGRRWCSMADCGTEAKKRRYVQRRRERRAAASM